MSIRFGCPGGLQSSGLSSVPSGSPARSRMSVSFQSCPSRAGRGRTTLLSFRMSRATSSPSASTGGSTRSTPSAHCSASRATPLLQPMPSFTRESGGTLHVAVMGVNRIGKGTAYNGHFGCTCYHPLFLFNQFGDLERCSLRPGNVHSADGWRNVLEPVVMRYKERKVRLYFRGDAAFASPEIYEYLEAEGLLYVIRLKANRDSPAEHCPSAYQPVDEVGTGHKRPGLIL